MRVRQNRIRKTDTQLRRPLVPRVNGEWADRGTALRRDVSVSRDRSCSGRGDRRAFGRRRGEPIARSVCARAGVSDEGGPACCTRRPRLNRAFVRGVPRKREHGHILHGKLVRRDGIDDRAEVMKLVHSLRGIPGRRQRRRRLDHAKEEDQPRRLLPSDIGYKVFIAFERKTPGGRMTDGGENGLGRSPVHLLHRASQGAEALFRCVMKDELTPRQLAVLWAEALFRCVMKDELTPRQLAVLWAVAAEEGLSQTAIVERTGADWSTTLNLVRRLVRRGWVRRQRSETDARAYALTLTEAGKGLLSAAMPLTRRVNTRVLSALPRAPRGVHGVLADDRRRSGRGGAWRDSPKGARTRR
jgi:DNA-binding MarR family transcriptional regulator